MYSFSISRQVWVFLYALGFGFALGLMYDALRLIRRLITRRDGGIIAQDILFFSLAAVLTFYFLLVCDMGQIRVYTLAAICTGFFVWYLSMGSIVLRYFDRASDALRSFFGLCMKPFRKLLSLVKRKSVRLSRRIVNKSQFFEKKFKILLQINKR